MKMQLNLDDITHILKLALAEDIGAGDITSTLTIPQNTQTEMFFTAREDIVICGLSVVKQLSKMVDNTLILELLAADGDNITAGAKLIKISGNARSVLLVERVALNFLQHMSGIATLSKQYADCVKGTDAIVLDTRKTTPCLRTLEKYAVSIGGCSNHRFCLDDMILIKDNHIAVAGGITKAVHAAQTGNANNLKIEVECDTIAQVEEAISVNADIIMLDNMTIGQLKEAVKITDGKAKLEASGGITLSSINRVAQTGVDYISVGALTHSAKNADIGLDAD